MSSADGIRPQRPLEQRNNARGGRSSARGSDRPARGRGSSARDGPSNDRVKPTPHQQQSGSASSPATNDVTDQAAKPVPVGVGKEAGDNVKTASEKPQMPSQSKPGSEPTVNNSETGATKNTANVASAVAPSGD